MPEASAGKVDLSRWRGRERLCEMCGLFASSAGAQCEVARKAGKPLCWHLAHQELEAADSAGDGAYVNAICWYGRAAFGECLHW